MNILKWLNEHFEEYILVALSAFTVIIIFTQVVMRYVFGSSLVWSEEIARYAFIWMIYIGVSYGAKKKKHLGVDAFAMLFKKKGELIIGIIANGAFLVFAAVMAYSGFDIVMKITRESAALQIPLSWIYAAPAVGMVLTSIRLVQNISAEVKELKSVSQQNSNLAKAPKMMNRQEDLV